MKTNNYYPELSYRLGDQWAPIPASEQGLQTIIAQPFVQGVSKGVDLEGLHFDRTGDILYFVNCPENLVCKVDMNTREVSVVCEVNKYAPGTYIASVKVHKDGRLFVAYMNPSFTDGGIFYINPDGSGFTQIDIVRGIVADDMVFDSQGGIYVVDMCGLPTKPTGGVMYITPDYQEIYTVIDQLAAPNGITLSKDESLLWVTDTMTGVLIRNEIAEDRKSIRTFGQSIVYKTTGAAGPDSIEIDDDDNVYNALYNQGRVMVFNRNGFPIGQILMPGREEGRHLRTTHPMVRPNTREIYICTNDDTGEGAWIMRAGSYAPANTKAFYRQ